MALALLNSVQAFQAPTMAPRSAVKASSPRMAEADLSDDGFGGTLGVLPPLGLFDPLGLIETRDMRRYEIMEIKHGRAAVLDLHDLVAAHVAGLDEAQRVKEAERREDTEGAAEAVVREIVDGHARRGGLGGGGAERRGLEGLHLGDESQHVGGRCR